MNQKLLRGSLIFAVFVLIVAFFYFDGSQYLSLNYMKTQQMVFHEYYANHRVQTIALFLLIYILSTALSLPGATVLTLGAGALFGLLIGTILVSFASTIGATCAFLMARFVFRESIQSRYNEKLKAINQGIEKDGAFYLFTLRLVPLFPFFMINLVMGLTPIRTFKFFFVSQIGMLPGTFVYVNAGTQIGEIDSLKGILSFDVLVSFALLGIFPILAKKSIEYFRKNKEQPSG